jgi:lipopolysaccharide biosynthesis glycosyltransferase
MHPAEGNNCPGSDRYLKRSASVAHARLAAALLELARLERLQQDPWIRLGGWLKHAPRESRRLLKTGWSRLQMMLPTPTRRAQRRAELQGLMLADLEEGGAPSNLDGLALASVVSESFVPGLMALLGSLKQWHPELRAPFHVFHQGDLSDTSCARLREVYPECVFRACNMEAYERIHPHERIGIASYLVFEAFGLEGFDRVIYLDSDMLCLRPLDRLFDLRTDFAACCDMGCDAYPSRQRGSRNYIFNTGMLVIGKKHLGSAVRDELVRLAASAPVPEDERLALFADQKILNLYFKDRAIEFLPASYNTLIRLATNYAKFDLAKVRLFHYAGRKPWQKKNKGKRGRFDEIWHAAHRGTLETLRMAAFRDSGELARMEALRNIHRGRRCFILGNGPSLKKQDLTLLKDEVTFVSNWFALHPRYREINPTYYCLCSHTIFGGWGIPYPVLHPDLEALLAETAPETAKFFPFCFKEYLETCTSLGGERTGYLLFEKPFKEFIDQKGSMNLDPARPLDDGHSVVVTFSMFLARWMGFSEVYLLGCDADHGEKGKTSHFYDGARHATLKSDPEHLQAVYARGRIFKAYRIAGEALAAEGVKVYNATEGGRLDLFPRVAYESLVKA